MDFTVLTDLRTVVPVSYDVFISGPTYVFKSHV